MVCEQKLEGVQMCWNFFAFGHGKDGVEGACALLKHEIHKEKIKPHAMRLQNAHDVVTFCQQRASMVVQLYFLNLG
jgi:hypothetical protein